MTKTQSTPFAKKCEILAEFWMTYRHDDEFQNFMEYADLGLPLAYAIANGVVKTTDEATRFVEDTFASLLSTLNIENDLGFANLNEVIDNSSDDEEED